MGRAALEASRAGTGAGAASAWIVLGLGGDGIGIVQIDAEDGLTVAPTWGPALGVAPLNLSG